MAKYIRTKDGVYDTEKLIYERIIDNKLYRVGWDVEKPTFEADILKQSDSIDELCDEFVLYDNQLNTYGVFVKKVIGFKWLQNHIDIYKGMTIYGAIWTDKGLIYVVKMNERGELELI